MIEVCQIGYTEISISLRAKWLVERERQTSQVSLTYPPHPSTTVRQPPPPALGDEMDGSSSRRDHFQLIYYLTKWSSNLFNNWFTLRQCQFIGIYCTARSTHLWLIPSSCSCAASYSSSDCGGTGTGTRLGSDWSPSLSRPANACCCGKCRASWCRGCHRCHYWWAHHSTTTSVGDAVVACFACTRARDLEWHCYPPPCNNRTEKGEGYSLFW